MELQFDAEPPDPGWSGTAEGTFGDDGAPISVLYFRRKGA
jgi:hypothetical protein